MSKSSKTLKPPYVSPKNTKFCLFSPYFSPPTPEKSRSRTPTRQGKVDMIIMMLVYHHLDHMDRFMRHLRKQLRPGGKFLIIDFRGKGGGDSHGHSHGHGHGHGDEHGHGQEHEHGHGHGHGHGDTHEHGHGHGHGHEEEKEEDGPLTHATFIKKMHEVGVDNFEHGGFKGTKAVLEFLTSGISFTPEDCVKDVEKAGFKHIDFLFDDTMNYHFMSLFENPWNHFQSPNLMPSISNTIFMVCDMQERFRTLIPNMPRMLISSKFLLETCQILNIPILMTG